MNGDIQDFYNNDIFEKILDRMSIAIIVTDPLKENILFGNKMFLKIYGYTKDELKNINTTNLYVAKTDREEILKKINKSEEICINNIQSIKADGTIFEAELHIQKTTINNKVVLLAEIIDVTERKRIEEKKNRLLKIKEAMIVVNQSIIGINNIGELFNLILDKAIEAIEGAKYGSVILLTKSKKLKIVASKGYSEEVVKEFCIPYEKSFQWLKTNGNFVCPIIVNHIDKLNDVFVLDEGFDNEKWNIRSCITSPIIIENRLYGIINIDSDKGEIFTEEDLEIMEYMRRQIEISVSKHKLYEETIYLSKYDKLTNLFNRSYFDDVLHSYLRSRKEFNLVIFDLNRLKLVNDNYGHLAGDKYIKTFVKGLVNIVDSNDIIARYGGDEFIGLFFRPINCLKVKFNELTQYFKSNPIFFDENRIICSFSYGVSNYPKDSNNHDELIRIADKRMYQYKYKTR